MTTDAVNVRTDTAADPETREASAAAAAEPKPAAAKAQPAEPSADNTFVAPEGVRLADVRLEGDDIIIEPAGAEPIVIEGGAASYSFIEIDGLVFPLTFILPEAGAPASSGGSFEEDPGEIGDPFGVTDLLPPTALVGGLQGGVVGAAEFSITPRDPVVSGLEGFGPLDEAGIPDTLEIAFSVAFDLPLDTAAAALTAQGLDGQLTSGGENVVFTVEDGVLVGRAGGEAVIRISLSPGEAGEGDVFTYSLTAELLGPIDHAGADDTQITLSGVTLSIGEEGSTSFDLSINDDVPDAQDDAYEGVEDQPVSGDVSLNDDAGADGSAGYALVEGSLTGAGELVFNDDGTFTYTPAAGEEGQVTFEYLATDGDGDAAQATVTIDLPADSEPELVSGAGAGVEVDEAGIPSEDANGFTVDFGADAPSAAGFAPGAADALNGQLTANGEPVVFSLEDGALVGRAGGEAVLRLTLEAGAQGPDGEVTYTVAVQLLGAVDHPGEGADAITLNGVAVSVADNDGDAAEFPVDVTIRDDVPDAQDDAYEGVEDQPVSGDVSLNDDAGADGSAGYALVEGSLTGAGELVFNDDGTFTYTPAAGEEGQVTFEYLATDGDGDAAQATVTIDLPADSEPELSGDAPGGINVFESAINDSGQTTFTVEFGGDAPGSAGFLLDGLDGQLASNGQPVVFALEDGVLVGRAGGQTVLTVSLEAGEPGPDGAVEYTLTAELLAPVTHSRSGADLESLENIGVEITDSDGDALVVRFDVDIRDDTPDADDDAFAAGEGGVVSGDVSLNDDTGADEPGSFSVADASDLEGVLDFASDGAFTYQAADGEFGLKTFTYTHTDADGDSATATVTLDLGAPPPPPPPPPCPDEPIVITPGGSGEGYRILGRMVNPDGSLTEASEAFVTMNHRGFGVEGNVGGVASQLGHDPVTGTSEQLIVELDYVATEAEISISNLFPNEARTGEEGRWEAYLDGELVASGAIDTTSSDKMTFGIDVPGGFDTLVFTALPYADPSVRPGDSSDYYVSSITVGGFACASRHHPEVSGREDATVDEAGFRGGAEAALLTDLAEVTVDFGGEPPAGADTLAAVSLLSAGLDGQLTANGQPVAFELVGGALVGFIGVDGDAGNPRIDVLGIEAVSATAEADGESITYGFEVSLLQPVDHPVAGVDALVTLAGVTLRIADPDGDPFEAAFDVDIRDDSESGDDEGSEVAGETGDEGGDGDEGSESGGETGDEGGDGDEGSEDGGETGDQGGGDGEGSADGGETGDEGGEDSQGASGQSGPAGPVLLGGASDPHPAGEGVLSLGDLVEEGEVDLSGLLGGGPGEAPASGGAGMTPGGFSETGGEDEVLALLLGSHG